jgi:hypothetical protein
MKKWTIDRNVGRLVEGRVYAFESRADAREYCDLFRSCVRAGPPQNIICADYRHVPVFSPEASDELKNLMVDMNALVVRSAILVAPEHATNALQVERVVRETGHVARRRFSDIPAMLAFLGEIALPAELARAKAFLSEG